MMLIEKRPPAIIPDGMLQYIEAWLPVGSRITCDPPVMKTDIDILVLVENYEKYNIVDFNLKQSGWIYGGSEISGDDESNKESLFGSYLKEDYNLIITPDEKFYVRFVAAHAACIKLNLLKKEDRITLFQAVLYQNRYATREYKPPRGERKCLKD